MMDKVMQRIEEALDAYARPFLTEHMGDVKVSRVELRGASSKEPCLMI